MNVVRRTDHAIYEYQQGRHCLLQYIASLKTPNREFVAALRSLCHFEQCIINLSLAIEMLERMIKPDMQRQRQSYDNKGQVDERLNGIFRNIKHFPGNWRKDASAITPMWLTNDGIVSLEKKISWQELKDVLDALVCISNPTWTAGRDFAIENGRNAGG